MEALENQQYGSGAGVIAAMLTAGAVQAAGISSEEPADSMSGALTSIQSSPDNESEREFHALARQWHRETDHLSNILRKAMSPAYQEIIGMGEKALPLILSDLETIGGHWFWALKAIARLDAAAGIDNYDDAVRAWLKWGSDHGYRHSECPAN